MTARRVLQDFWLAGILAASALSPTSGAAQVPAETEARLRSIFEARDFDARSFPGDLDARRRGIHDSRDAVGSGGARTCPVRRRKVATGQSSPPSPTSLHPGSSLPLSISGYQFSLDGGWILLQAEGDGFWMFDVATSTLKHVEGGGGNAISPEGGRILLPKRAGDLHVHDLAADHTTRLTWITAESVSNGRAVWSPDGNRIAFVQSDSSGVRMRSMLVPNDPSYPELREVRFARVGETIAKPAGWLWWTPGAGKSGGCRSLPRTRASISGR